MAKKKPVLAVYAGARNDRNGNPRRGWLVYDREGTVLAFADEGYQGHGALRAAGFEKVPRTGQIAITPGEYRNLLQQHDRKTPPGGSL